MTKPFYKPEDLAKMLDLNVMTIYRYIKSGRIKASKLERRYRISQKDFDSFLKVI